MKWSTTVELPLGEWQIRHEDRILLIGSCFAQHIGQYLHRHRFMYEVNPYGILYNPASMATALTEIMAGKSYTDADLQEQRGLWHSWAHHGEFSSADKAETLHRINERITAARQQLAEGRWLILTFGTAWMYRHIETEQVVGNCHQYPDRTFRRELMTVEDIVRRYEELITELRVFSSDIQILFTVSPVRHAKDGMHGNQLSKATLLLAIDRLCREQAGCHYFPAYELLMDELRDYRFYADDLLHPSAAAVQHVCEAFAQCSFSAPTQEVMRRIADVQARLEHRPLHPDSETYRHFMSDTLQRLTDLQTEFPTINFQKDITLCQNRLNTSLR